MPIEPQYTCGTYKRIVVDDYETNLEQLLYEVNDAKEMAEGDGWIKLRVDLESQLDPYETDCTSNPIAFVRGERPMTTLEVKEKENQEAIQKYATENKMTFYEASTILRLKEQGKL